jgi:hypothetical protein
VVWWDYSAETVTEDEAKGVLQTLREVLDEKPFTP